MLICFISFHAHAILDTLDLVSAYAKKHPELVAIDNQDYLNPDYSSFYETFLFNRWDKFLGSIGLKNRADWEHGPFLALIKRITDLRKEKQYTSGFLRKFEVSQGDHILVWSNLQGAFHSLVAALEHLREKKIIDNDFKIIAPKYYMVFNGNVIDRSPYSLETLTLVLRILDLNPGRVAYVLGNHETQGMWEDYDFRSELEYKIARNRGLLPPYKNDIVPYTDEINEFFSTLPSLLYLVQKTSDRADGIRIGFLDRSSFELSFNELKYLLNVENTPFLSRPLVLPKDRSNEKPGEIYAMLSGSDDLIPNYTSQGLLLLPPDRGTTAWSVLSSPTQTYQKLYNFYTDSFVDIAIQTPMNQTTITHYYQDVRKRDGFKAGRVYNMFTGQSEEQFRAMKSYEMIRVGGSIDLKGPTQTLGKQIKAGISLVVNKQNQQGIIPGNFIALTLFNDDYISTKIRPNIENLITNYKTNIILAPNEKFLQKEYLDLLVKKEIIVLFPFNSVAAMRSPEYQNLIHYGPSFIDEAEISTQYILKKVGPRKIVLVYEEGSNAGEDALLGARMACKEQGYNAVVEIPLKGNVLDFKEEINQVIKENPDVIGFFVSVAVAQDFIRQMGIQHIAQKLLYGTSALGVGSFRHYYKERGLNFITTNLVPNPANSELPLVQEFRKDAEENNVPLSPQALEAYTVASIFVEGLRIIKGPITHASIIKSFESMQQYAFKGLTLNFDKDTREVSNAVWLDTGEKDAEWKKYTAKKRTPAELASISKSLGNKTQEPEKKLTSWW